MLIWGLVSELLDVCCGNGRGLKISKEIDRRISRQDSGFNENISLGKLILEMKSENFSFKFRTACNFKQKMFDTPCLFLCDFLQISLHVKNEDNSIEKYWDNFNSTIYKANLE